jgi:prepilin-type processing-associated H-X9-DG protein/prepilin-type N-terminal cleavage/methylation domain-containing protein
MTLGHPFEIQKRSRACLAASMLDLRPQRKPTLAGCAAFTLLELLTVVAIISILASLLFAGLARAKKTAYSAKCKNNLRQIGLGLRMYVLDTGFYPLLETPGLEAPTGPYGTIKGGKYWQDNLRPYTGNSWYDPLYQCPEYRGWLQDGDCWFSGNNLGTLHQVGSYSYNGFPFVWSDTGPGSNPGLGGDTLSQKPPGKFYWRPESSVNVPSDMIAIGDSILEQVEVKNSGRSWGPFLTGTHWINYGDQGFGPAIGIMWQNSREERRKRGVKAAQQRHNDRFNVLFCDGHVDGLRRANLFLVDPGVTKRWAADNQPRPVYFWSW